MVKEFHDTLSRFDTIHVWRTNGRTDRRNWRGIYTLQHICCRT